MNSPENESSQMPPVELPAASAAAHRSATAPVPPTEVAPQRLKSLDAYRGLIMITLAFSGFGIAATAALHLKEDPDSAIWQALRYQFSHVEWVGCSYWDMIQPSFMFMVGAAMAFSYAKRRQLGHSWVRMLGHALTRSLVLILLGIFLISDSDRRTSTNWSLMNVLTQIGLGYTFLFLLWNKHPILQTGAAVLILAGAWFLYDNYPDAGVKPPIAKSKFGYDKDWANEHLSGMPPAWHKNANVGHEIDLYLLNWLPREREFVFNRGGYQTINFLPSLATMLFGLMAGELLRSRSSDWLKLLLLIAAGTAGIVAGWVLHEMDVCPLVKRIWTPSWALFSGGWCCLILATLYGIVDVRGWQRWTFPLVVVGMNSIAIYCMSQLLKGWTARTYRTHFGAEIFTQFGLYEPLVRFTVIGLTFWLICWWMYRQKIFVRI